MLATLFLITLWAWVSVVCLTLLSSCIKNNTALKLSRAATIIPAIFTIALGLTGLITKQTFVQYIPGLFFGIHPSLKLDSLSSFFILLTGVCYFGVSLYSLAYFNHFTFSQQKRLQLFETLFVFAIVIVFTALDALSFLFAWEIMALSSYFLVVSIEPSKNARRAGFLYLGIAHIGFLAIAIAFFLLSSPEIVSAENLPLTNTIFILALFGFGAKAGLFPLHVWLPEAHPAAPSPISALMSGVMIKTAIYGLIRFTFDFLLPYQQSWWGYLLMSLGLITMFVGVIHAAMQTDMKRLLAYSSIENIGLICTALGLAIIFNQDHRYTLSTIAFLVVLLHSLNHSIFKSLLFLGTGSILHATCEKNLGKLGGLIHKMPWISVCTLIGTLSMAGLPLFNGFVSEWLYLSIFFHHAPSSQFLLTILSPLIIALSVFIFGLAGFVIVKFYGIAFLGQPRESQLTHAHEGSPFERAGLTWLAGLCLLLGLYPNSLLALISPIANNLYSNLPDIMPTKALALQWVFSTTYTNGFNPIVLCSSIGLLLLISFIFFKRISPWPIRRSQSWGCGFHSITPRMQDTAEGFGQPFKQIFSSLITIKLQLPKPDDKKPHYHSELTEKIWGWLYFPLIALALQLTALTKWVQQGRISAYLLYIGITLLILLTWVVWS